MADDEGARGSTGEVPDVAGARDHVVDEVVRFGRALRRAGVDVPSNGALAATRALVELGLDDEDRVRAGLRAALVARREDVPTFDRLFAEFWDRLRSEFDADAWSDDEAVPGEAVQPSGSLASFEGEQPTGRPDDAEDDAGEPDHAPSAVETAVGGRAGDDDAEGPLTTAAYSPQGRATPVDLELATDPSDGLGAAVDRLLGAIGGRRGRRWDRSGAGSADARRALRRSLGTGGAVLELPERQKRRDAVRVVFLVDVSQSVLDAVDRRFLVRFLRTVHVRSRAARVFFFDSSVREVTGEFDARTDADALAALERAQTTWGGGTRIGHALRTVRTDHRDAVDRTTTVFLVSDGLERGEVDVLEAEMAHLAKRAASVLWLNPLAASPEFEPASRGMAAALPFLDGLFALGGPEDVAELARQLSLHGPGAGVGYEHDHRRRDATD